MVFIQVNECIYHNLVRLVIIIITIDCTIMSIGWIINASVGELSLIPSEGITLKTGDMVYITGGVLKRIIRKGHSSDKRVC